MRIFLTSVPVFVLTALWTAPTTALLLRSAASLANHRPRYGTVLFDTSSPRNAEYSGKEQINGLELQKKKLEAALERIDTLREFIKQAPDPQALAALEANICQVEETVSLSELVPPSGLLSSDYTRAIRIFLKLPLTSRLALCEALEISDSGQAASDWDRVPAIVSKLYEDRFLLTSQRLRDALKSVELRRRERRQQVQSLPKPPSDNSSNLATRNNLMSIFDGSLNPEEVQSEGTVQQLLGRVTRKEGRVATPEDLNALMLVLGKDTFVASGKEAIS
jgi:hypothetical protein